MSNGSTSRSRSPALLTAAIVLAGALLVSVTGVGAGGPGPAVSAPGEAGTRTVPREDPAVPALDDVPPGHPFYDEIVWMVLNGISQPSGGAFFRPTEPVSRQAMAAFLHRYALTAAGAAAAPECTAAPFTDVPVSNPFCADIAWLVDHGIAEGYPDGSFHPTAPVSRQAMAAFLQRLEADAVPEVLTACAAPVFADVPADHLFCAEIAWLVDYGIATGFADGGFHPEAAISRQAMAAFLFRFDAAFGDAPIPSGGCGTSTQAAVTAESRTITVGDTERSYLLTVPAAHDGATPIPLVFDFHGFGEGAVIHTMMSEAGPIAAREGFAVVYPQGRGSPAFWQINITGPNPDLDFVDALLDRLDADLCVDLTRFYVMGLSNGAFMSSTLGCARSDRFAAIAPVAGVQHASGCAPNRPVPVVSFHGTADPILGFNGGFGSIGGTTTTTAVPVDLHGPGYPANMAAWAAANGCEPDDTDTPVTDEVILRVYDCPDGADVEFFIILEGGHAWPGSAFSVAIAAVVGYTTLDIHASEEAWSFFERFHLPRWTE